MQEKEDSIKEAPTLAERVLESNLSNADKIEIIQRLGNNNNFVYPYPNQGIVYRDKTPLNPNEIRC